MAIVDASSVPEMPADPTALLAAAATISPAAASVGERTADAVTRWSTLGDAFDTPDTSTAVGRAQPLVAIADDFEEAGPAVADAIRALGETLAALERTRAQLAAEVEAHVTEVSRYQASVAGQDEMARGILDGMGLSGWSQNESLRQRCAQLRAQFQAALLACEQDLRRIGDPAVSLPTAAPAPSAPLGERATVFADAVSMSVLHRLASAPPGDVEKLLAAHPDWIALVRDHPPTPDEISEWWKSLDSTSAAALVSGAPVLMGNLDGVAYGARDQANRKTLEREITRLRAELEDLDSLDAAGWEPGYGVGGGTGAQKVMIEQQIANLTNIEGALRSPRNAASRYLIELTGDMPPLAAIAIGDLDSARTATFAVPGMGTTTRDMTGWTNAAQNLFDEQTRVSQDGDRAVVAWIGYRTPPIPVSQGGFDVLDNTLAEQGATNLSSALSGASAVREDTLTLNVLGHSYGSTTASIALTRNSTPRVDTFVTIGSAGLPSWIDSASRLNVGAVYSGQARNVMPFLENQQGDQWAWTGRTSTSHPVDPTNSGFGGNAFGADGDNGMYPVTDHGVLVDSGKGWGYLNGGTESLFNAALATTGKGDEVTPAVEKGLTDQQTMWRDVMLSGGGSL